MCPLSGFWGAGVVFRLLLGCLGGVFRVVLRVQKYVRFGLGESWVFLGCPYYNFGV